MADRQMADLYETITVTSDIEVDITKTAQRIVGTEPTEGHDTAFGVTCCFHCIEDTRRTPRTADRDQKITGTSVQLKLLGKNLIIAEIIAETGEHRAVIERERTDAAIL